jgi:hypothetical protein
VGLNRRQARNLYRLAYSRENSEWNAKDLCTELRLDTALVFRMIDFQVINFQKTNNDDESKCRLDSDSTQIPESAFPKEMCQIPVRKESIFEFAKCLELTVFQFQALMMKLRQTLYSKEGDEKYPYFIDDQVFKHPSVFRCNKGLFIFDLGLSQDQINKLEAYTQRCRSDPEISAFIKKHWRGDTYLQAKMREKQENRSRSRGGSESRQPAIV